MAQVPKGQTADQLNSKLVQNFQQLENNGQKKLYQFIVSTKTKGAPQQQIEECMQKYGVSNLQTNKLLKELLQKQFIAVQQSGNRKVYFMAELRPQDQNLPPWYNGQFFDDGYCQTLQQVVKQTIGGARNVVVNIDYIVNLIKNQPQLKSRLSDKDIKTIVNALVYDGEVLEFENLQAGCKCYRLAAGGQQQSLLGPYFQGQYCRTVPCGRCQLVRVCENGGGISARTCLYVKQWLKGE